MFGPPKDVEGECNARLYIADDYGDNTATMRCQLEPGHDGPHREEYQRHGKPVVVTWHVDDREEEAEDEDNVEGWEDALDEDGFGESGGVVFAGGEDDDEG
jgi:hypothetical protein